ncbi:PD40 domain-containing protein [Flagellimonas sp. CMM7]|uniref:TolB family protein n=1 Tax=Flagellimonas sp. CMM7 TaxID=2654676 RepID=UPI0013D63B82|nr:PD40 domain-containing protein [Flagellimonas sp. CMM7]UII81136.1 PD40 domain-containing protein [Flagellimonas sp. CMM7]
MKIENIIKEWRDMTTSNIKFNYNLCKYFLGIISAAIPLSCTNEKQQQTLPKNGIENPFQKLDSLGETPVMFYPNIVSTAIDKFNTSFSPDGNTIYYTATSQKLGITGIAYQEFVNGTYSQPKFVPFVSFDIATADVQISPDGRRMLFSTYEEYEGKPEGFNFNLWESRLKEGLWQKPTPIGGSIASKGNEFYPVMTKNGNLYFNSDKSGNSDLYYAKFENDTYGEPIPLPKNINTDAREADAFVAQDESFIIFVRVDEPDGYGNSDLYISFNKGGDEWTDPINMGKTINSDQIDGSPYVTPDGKHLLFTSGRISPNTKETAMESYARFKSTMTSSNNGSLNFFIVKLNLTRYKELATSSD